jgi:uncharacterized protein (TIGR01777 family)
MKVLITGATGLIGSEITRLCLENSIDVHFLTSSKGKLNSLNNCKGFYWNSNENSIDPKCIEGVDAIINLAGASISRRWTEDYKSKILSSRLGSLELLRQVLKNQNHQVKQIISASAIGIYPDSLTNYYDEDNQQTSDSFLSEVVKSWEEKANTFTDLNLLVSKVRIGLVLANDGGALPSIVKPIKFGLGAAFGSGKQWQSWIHIKDLADIFMFLLKHKLEGVYNGVAPNAVTNIEMTKAIAHILNRPLILPNLPKFAMELILGEMHILLFESQRVSSKKIENIGFKFKFPNLEAALQNLL